MSDIDELSISSDEPSYQPRQRLYDAQVTHDNDIEMSSPTGDDNRTEDMNIPEHGDQVMEDEVGDEGPARDDYKSKRQRRLATIKNPGSNGKSMGDVVEESDGSIIWWNEDGDAGDGTIGTWEEAVYHNDIRKELLAKANSNGRESYDYPRKCGRDASDETSFLASQKAWRGEKKEYWHTIADNILNRFEAKGYRGPENPVGWMYFKHKVVLDLDNHPVRDFHDLPATMSSAAEPWLLEAISRIDGRIFQTDFRARMPWTYTTQSGKQQTLFTSAAIGNRTMRFRETHGLIPWTLKLGSGPWKAYILSIMTPAQIANNTTEGLGTFSTADIKAAKTGQGNPSRRTPRISRIEKRAVRVKRNKAFLSSKSWKPKVPTESPSNLGSQSLIPSTISNISQDVGASGWYPTAQEFNPLERPLHMEEMHQHGQTNLLTSLTLTASQPNAIDYRTVDPTSEQEKAYIQAALQVTHELFVLHFDRTAPTTQELSYSRQWDELQIIYHNNTDPAIRADRNMPTVLPRLTRWYGGFEAWASVAIINGRCDR